MNKKPIMDIKIEANGPHIYFYEIGGQKDA